MQHRSRSPSGERQTVAPVAARLSSPAGPGMCCLIVPSGTECESRYPSWTPPVSSALSMS